MQKIITASLNPVKIESTQKGIGLFLDEFSVTGVRSESGVSDQPFGEETYQGAENRVKYIINKQNPEDNSIIVAIEGGIFNIYDRYIAKGIVCVSDVKGNMAFGESAGFEINKAMMEKIREGYEMGKVVDMFTGRENTKQGGGAVGYLTGGKYTRTDLYIGGVINAFVPFLNKKAYGLI